MAQSFSGRSHILIFSSLHMVSNSVVGVSMYSSYNKPIYGSKSATNDSCLCTVNPPISTGLHNLLVLINTLKVSIRKYLPAIELNVPIRGTVTSKMFVPPIIMVRLLWVDRNPGAKQNRDNYFYRQSIRDLYYQLGRSEAWTQDPLSLILP